MKRRSNTLTPSTLAAIDAWVHEPPQFASADDDGIVYLPRMRRSSYAMSSAILCSALFGVGKGQCKVVNGKRKFIRKIIECTFRTTNGATIEYRGWQLRQDDLTVLLGLLSKRWGMATCCAIEFAPSTFCTEIGWSDSEYNTLRLKDCLIRLRGAFLIVHAVKKADDADKSKLAKAIGTGWTLGFVSQFKFDGDSNWAVQLDDRVGQLFNAAPTYLIAAKRKQLSEGLQTWLYGYVEANTCTYAVPLKTLHDACGSPAPLKEFARQVRDALPKLVAVRAVRDTSTVKNGKVAIFKIASSKPKSLKS